MATAPKLATPEVHYPDSDGKPMAETDLHREVMTDLIQRLQARYAKRDDVYVTGNLLVYYVEGEPRVSLAPDCSVTFGVAPGPRRTYKVWEEGVFPTVVFEITSETTRREDMEHKFDIYEDIWKVKELFLFDPTEDYLDPSLVGYRLTRGELKVIKPADGRVASKHLGITLERAGTRLVVRDVKTGAELPLPETPEARKAKRKVRELRAEVEQLKAELVALRKSRPGA